MRRSGLLALGAVLAAGLVLLLALALTRESRLVYTIGGSAGFPVAELQPGQEACQAPVSPPADAFDRVVISLGTYFRAGQPVDVLVRAVGSRDVLARGRLPGGYPDIGQAPEHAVPVGRTTLRAPAEFCLRNAGTRKVAVYGTIGLAHRTSTGSIEGRPIDADLAVRLERSEPRSLLARLPRAVTHAAMFKGGMVGPWTVWVLGALVLVAVPALVARSLAGALRDDG